MGLAFLITSDAFQLMSERKVLKEAEYKALLDATAVIDASRQEARRIVTQAENRAEANKKKAYLEGMAQARAEHAERLLSEAAAAENQLRAMRSSMANVVVKAVTQFLTEADPQELLEAALQKVDVLIRGESFVTVMVPPSGEATMTAALDKLRSSGKWTLNVTVLTDTSLARGTCRMKTATGFVEIGLDAQIAAMKKIIERRVMGHG